MTGEHDLEALLRESADEGNPDADEIRTILREARTIAVVGMSRNPAKEARRIPAYLVSQGYDIIPVNPSADRIIGRAARNSLAEVEEEVDVVLVFRPSEEAEVVVEEAAARAETPIIWLQEGIWATDAAPGARAAGGTVIQNLCMWKVHQALLAEEG